MPTLTLLGTLVLATLLQEEPAPTPPPLELLDHASLSAALHELAESDAQHVTLLQLGHSRGGRALEALRIAGAGGDEPGRPAILLVANLEGPRVYASSVALQHARTLVAGYAADERVKALLDSTTVFVVPRANPDAAEGRFVAPRMERWASGPGVDDDRDGRMGEDPRQDVDGDGAVTTMRVEDPDGEWRADAGDARVLVKADRAKGERGVYVTWPEGRDLDGDEAVAEDEASDARVDRNFPAGWQQHARDAGVFPTDEPEVRALCDFVLAHPELALVVVYDGLDSLVGEPKSVKDDAPRVKRIPPEGVLESDAKLVGELGKRYREATESTAKGDAGDDGTFARWCYEHRGLVTLSAKLWDIPLEEKKKEGAEEKKDDAAAGETPPQEPKAEAPPSEAPPSAERRPGGGGRRGGARPPGGAGAAAGGGAGDKGGDAKPTDDLKRLKWIDSAGPDEAWRFVAWKPFEHPELGPVEIGGFAPYARIEPPAADSGAIAQRHLDWFLGLGELVARVRLVEVTRERLGEGVERVTAVLQNDAFLPLLSSSARRTETLRPAKVTLLLPDAAERLAGAPIELVSELPGSGGRKELTWLVRGPAGMEIAVRVETTHAGVETKNAEAKR